MKLIIGLGNPGKQYEKTRHNIGFMLLDNFARKHNLEFNKNKFNGDYAVGYVNQEKYILLKPQSYMNLSGEVLRKFKDYFDIDIQDILVIYDDLDTSTANFRLRGKGSSGGHNGIKNIISHLSTENFYRLKIGINRPSNGMKVTDYVLGNFSKQEFLDLETIYDKTNSCLEDFSTLSFIDLMNKYN